MHAAFDVCDPLATGLDPLLHSLARKRVSLAVKRIAEVLAALAGLLVCAPLLALIALSIVLTSSGPALFRQRRIGYRGREFVMYKFRTMRVTTDPALTARQAADAARGVLFKPSNDPRVTAVGAFLRATSLDELPQLFNVVKGDMSLIGPRPLVPFMLEPYPEFARARALVRPGLTGLWQIHDRANNTSAQAMMPHDLKYIREFSLGLDLRILLQTVRVVFSRKGAC